MSETIVLTPRQVGQRIRRGTLQPFIKGGRIKCSRCERLLKGDTESLRFWSKGDRVYCPHCKRLTIARPVFGSIELDLKLHRR